MEQQVLLRVVKNRIGSTLTLATSLKSDEKVRLEFYVITMRKKRKKLVAIFELMLQALIESKYLDLPEENLFRSE